MNTTRFQVTTETGLVLASYLGSLRSAYDYADQCHARGWSSLQIRDQWTGQVVSRA